MSLAAYQNNQDLDVLSASPMQLVCMLYEGAITAIHMAREHLRTGDIRARSHQITKACAIIEELTLSLDRANGGEVATELVELYVYLHQRLIAANIEQTAEPLVEVAKHLSLLLEAWKQVPDLAGTAAYNSTSFGSTHLFSTGEDAYGGRLPLQLSA